MQTLNVAIVGCGRIGKVHAKNIENLAQFNLVACCDPIHVLPNIPHYSDYEELLLHPGLEAVLLCSPSSLHTRQIIQAAKANKQVFCEKPIGLNDPDILEADQVCKQYDVLLQIGFNRRFDPDFSHLKQSMASYPDFKPHLLKITSRDPHPPAKEYLQQSGGIFFDMMIHDFDMVRFLINSDIKEIFAMGSQPVGSVFEECNDYAQALVQLKCKNGCLVVIENSRQTNYGYDQRIEVYDNNVRFNVGNILDNQLIHQNTQGVITANPQSFFLERYEQAYIKQLLAFYEACISKSKPLVTALDGLKAYQLACAATESAKSNKVIELEES